MPDARTAISNITSSIKVPAFISNAKAALRGLVTLGEMRSLLVNSGMTTEAGKYFLDAAYGKTLADQISQLNSQHFARANGNIKYGMNGIYAGKFANGPVIQGISDVYGACIYIISSNSGETAAYAFTISNYSTGHLFFNRMNSSNSWQLTPWKQLL